MSNLSELLPAGGGGKNVNFVASGSVSNGVAVSLNSDGTVSSGNNTDFLGISDAAISSGASGSITIKGGLKSGLSSLTPNSIYYVQSNGTVSTSSAGVRIGKSLSSTTLNLEFNS